MAFGVPMGGVGDPLQLAKSAAEQIESVKRSKLLMSDVSRKLNERAAKNVRGRMAQFPRGGLAPKRGLG
jgi:hypothetical protein